MSEMVERVARALCEQSYSESEEKRPWYWPSETGDERDEWRAMARIAIQAMREPTEGTTGAGAWALTILYAAGRVEMDEKDLDLSVINCIWGAMIDECLDPGTSPAWSDDSDYTLKQIAEALK